MKSKNIKGITIEIDGNTQGLDKALGNVEKDAKSLQSELNGVNKLLKLDPTNVDLLKQKETLLNKTIEETKKKLETLKTAQTQLKSNGVDETSEAYRDLQREIVNTENKLKGLENEQTEFVRENSNITKIANQYENLGNKMSAAGNALMPISTAAAGALAGIGAVTVTSGQAADELNTLSKQYGLTTEQLQKYAYAEELVDVSTESVAKGLSRTTKQMGKAAEGTGDAAEIYKQLGVAVTDSKGNLREADDVFFDTIDALGQVENETQRNIYAQTLFGKSYQDLNPLIEGGADTLRELSDQFDEMNLTIPQDTLDAANEFNDELDLIKATAKQCALIVGTSLAENFGTSFEGIREKMAELANAFANLPQGVQTVILAVIGFIAALGPMLIIGGQIATGISSIITLVSGIPAAIGVVSTAVGAIGGVLSTVGTALSGLWMLMLANPITLIIAAIVACVAAFVILWKKCEGFRNFWKTLWAGIKNGVTAAVDKIKSVWGKLPTLMKNIGKNIIKGLAGGMFGMQAYLLRMAAKIISNLIRSIKNKLGIASPSKVMAKEVGKWIPAGIAKGITTNLSVMKEASNVMNNIVIDSPDKMYSGIADRIGSAVGSNVTQATAAATTTQTVVNQTNNFNVENTSPIETIRLLKNQANLGLAGA